MESFASSNYESLAELFRNQALPSARIAPFGLFLISLDLGYTFSFRWWARLGFGPMFSAAARVQGDSELDRPERPLHYPRTFDPDS